MVDFHITEIKYRFCYCLLNIFIIFIIIWDNKIQILCTISDFDLIYTSLPEAFQQYIYFSLIISLIFNIPILLYNYILFNISGWYLYEFKIIIYNIFKYSILFILFYNICYFKLFEYIINFFIEFESYNLRLNLKITDFISFINSYSILFIILFILSFIKINIKGKRKYIYITLLIFMALITPPDVLSLIMCTIPIIILFELRYFLEGLVY